jgi:hypothetical protein
MTRRWFSVVSVPRTVLQALAHGPVEREQLQAIAREAGKRHNGNVALLRLQEGGLIKCEVRLTAKGRKFLREYSQ